MQSPVNSLSKVVDDWSHGSGVVRHLNDESVSYEMRRVTEDTLPQCFLLGCVEWLALLLGVLRICCDFYDYN